MGRETFHQRVELAILTEPEAQRPSALFLVDIDRFSELNRALGFRLGDAVLKSCADQLAAKIRSVDMLARHDGARFAIWMSDASQRVEVLQLSERLLEITSAHLPSVSTHSSASDSSEVSITLSIGCAVYPRSGQTLDELISSALAALAVAKQMGGGRLQLADSTPQISKDQTNDPDGSIAVSPNAWTLQNDLVQAIDENTLSLYYQPVVCLLTGRVSGVEALLRPKIEAYAGQTTEQIMNLAEQLPVIEKLTRWGLLEACQAASEARVPVAVNLPPGVLRNPQFIAWVTAAIEGASISASDLTLEITERALAQTDDLLIKTLMQLNGLGCKLAIDDFGVGYSSLAQLVRLPIQKVKLDRSLLPLAGQSMELFRKCTILLKHLISLSKELGLQTVAEGVETAEQFAMLNSFGCDFAQGYYLSRPQPLQKLSAIIETINLSR
jgi:diguanylate cyclase (GGDEF)-like protein